MDPTLAAPLAVTLTSPPAAPLEHTQADELMQVDTPKPTGMLDDPKYSIAAERVDKEEAMRGDWNIADKKNRKTHTSRKSQSGKTKIT